MPGFVKELVRVVSWVQEPGKLFEDQLTLKVPLNFFSSSTAFFIYPSLQGGKLTFHVTSIFFTFDLLSFSTDGKYHLLPSGELLIHNLEYNDRYASYRCRTMHKLTRQVVISVPAKIRINGKSFQPHTEFAINYKISNIRTSRNNISKHC